MSLLTRIMKRKLVFSTETLQTALKMKKDQIVGFLKSKGRTIRKSTKKDELVSLYIMYNTILNPDSLDSDALEPVFEISKRALANLLTKSTKELKEMVKEMKIKVSKKSKFTLLVGILRHDNLYEAQICNAEEYDEEEDDDAKMEELTSSFTSTPGPEFETIKEQTEIVPFEMIEEDEIEENDSRDIPLEDDDDDVLIGIETNQGPEPEPECECSFEEDEVEENDSRDIAPGTAISAIDYLIGVFDIKREPECECSFEEDEVEENDSRDIVAEGPKPEVNKFLIEYTQPEPVRIQMIEYEAPKKRKEIKKRLVSKKKKKKPSKVIRKRFVPGKRFNKKKKLDINRRHSSKKM